MVGLLRVWSSGLLLWGSVHRRGQNQSLIGLTFCLAGPRVNGETMAEYAIPEVDESTGGMAMFDRFVLPGLPCISRTSWMAGWHPEALEGQSDWKVADMILGWGADDTKCPRSAVQASWIGADAAPLVSNISRREFREASALPSSAPSERCRPYLKDFHPVLAGSLELVSPSGRPEDASVAKSPCFRIPDAFDEDALNLFWDWGLQSLEAQVPPMPPSDADTASSDTTCGFDSVSCWDGGNPALHPAPARAVKTAGTGPSSRPDDFRFAYIGGAGTWTPLHSDVLGTHSWSASVRGAKVWIILAPGAGVRLGLLDSAGDLLPGASGDVRAAALWGVARREYVRRFTACGGAESRCDAAEAAWEWGSALLPALPAESALGPAEPLRWEAGTGAAAGSEACGASSDAGASPAELSHSGDLAVVVQWAGDTLLVPYGWPHAVYNMPIPAAAPDPPLSVSLNANWLPGPGLCTLARLCCRESAAARTAIADCLPAGLLPARGAADAVAFAWEWQVQRVVRGSAQIDVADATRLIHAAAVRASWRMARHPGSDCATMAASTRRCARKALKLLARDPFLAWMLANPAEAERAALDATQPESRIDLPGGGWVGTSKEFFGCRIPSLAAFWSAEVASLAD